MAEQINRKIRQNNAILADIPAKRKECANTLMATACQADIAVYQREDVRIKAELSKLHGDQEKAEEDIDTLNDDIAQLNKQTVNTTAAKDSINALIKSSGF